MVDRGQIARAVEILTDGGVVAFPTETVYGLGALANNARGVQRIFAIKGRPKHRALIVHLDKVDAIENYAYHVPPYAWKLAKAFWPGPLTMVFAKREQVLDDVTGGGDTVALRIPNHPVALQLIAEVRKVAGDTAGLAAPSANRFGEPPAMSAQDVVRDLGAPGKRESPDMILDGGACPGRVPSTILSCVGEWPRILRRGGTPPEDIEEIIGRWVDQ